MHTRRPGAAWSEKTRADRDGSPLGAAAARRRSLGQDQLALVGAAQAVELAAMLDLDLAGAGEKRHARHAAQGLAWCRRAGAPLPCRLRSIFIGKPSAIGASRHHARPCPRAGRLDASNPGAAAVPTLDSASAVRLQCK